MPSRNELLIEANSRGLLRGQQKQLFDEAVSRGLIQLPAEQVSDQQLQQVQVAEPPSQLQQAALQGSVEYPAERTSLGAFGQGVKRGFQDLGFGILQRGSEVADFLGFDTEEFQGKIRLAEDIERQKFKKTEEERPIAATAGEITGAVASFPVPAQTVRGAAAVGGAYGLLKTAEDKEGIAKNVIQEAAFGGVGQAAAPYIQKGFNKAQALFSGIYKKATGVDPRPDMFLPDGNLSKEGKSSLSELGLSEEDFSRIYQNLDENLEPIAAARQERAKEFGVDISTGEATQDFAQQEAEQSLKSGLGREAESARLLEAKKQQQLREAQTGFVRDISPTGQVETAGDEFTQQALREERGATVQQTLRDLEKEGQEQIRQRYKEAAEIPGEAVPFDNDRLLDVIDDNLLQRPVDDKVITTVESAMAKYGLIGGEPEKKGRFFQVIDDDGKPIKFKGEQTPLSLQNAEEFRKELNKVRGGDTSGAVTQIINDFDQQVDDIIEELPQGSERQQAFFDARRAAAEQKQVYSAKDVIQKLVGYKKGTRTDMLSPDRVIREVINSPDALANIRRVKSVLTKNPTEKTEGAWRSVQAQSVADLFSKSINPPTGEVSGQRLATAIKGFGGGSVEEGEKRLKVILGDKYNEFDRLRKVIGDATIPLKGTTNPSGTAYKMLNFMVRMGSVGQFSAESLLSLGQKAKDAAAARKTLRQIERADPGKVKQAVKANDALIDSYIQLGLTGTLRGVGTERAE